MATAAASALDAISYTDLYTRWEKGNWSAMEIDFTEDRRQWHEEWSDFHRKAALWNYSLFFHGEDAVTDGLSPYIDAAPTEEQKYFLATQQVDEARHAVFFARFMREVVDRGGSDIASVLQATETQLNWGWKHVFGRLEQMADELRKDRSKAKFAQAIALYHIVIEATLAQPGQHFIESYLEANDWLPGFRSGMKNVALDEQRHIGFGVKVLSELIKDDQEVRDAVIEELRGIIRYTVGVFSPPGGDEQYAECFGFTMEEISLEGFISVETKLRTAGFTDDEIQRGLILPMDKTPQERAERSMKLLRAGLIGEPNGHVDRDPELVGMLFESIALAVDHRHVPKRPTTIQWNFTDYQPWHLRIDNGSTHGQWGRAESPDLTLTSSFEDWLNVARGEEDPRRAFLTRKVRPRGSPRLLLKMGKIFG